LLLAIFTEKYLMDYIDDSYRPPKLVEGEDYYMHPKGFRIMTEKFAVSLAKIR